MVWLLSFMWTASVMLADDGSVSRALTPQQIAEWIHQLDSDDFMARGDAVQKLEAAGPVAFDALAEAAMSEGRERRWHCLTLLRKAFQEGEPAWRQAAGEAFEKIAAGPRPIPARFATDLLRPTPVRPTVPAVTTPSPPHRIPHFNATPASVPVHRSQMLQDGPRKVQIIESPRDGVEVQITEIKDGMQLEQKGQARDFAELQEKHPELFEAMLAARRKYAVSMLRNCKLQLEQCLAAVETAAKGADDAEQLTQSVERLKTLADQLERETFILAPQ